MVPKKKYIVLAPGIELGTLPGETLMGRQNFTTKLNEQFDIKIFLYIIYCLVLFYFVAKYLSFQLANIYLDLVVGGDNHCCMPRLPPSLLRLANYESRFLPEILFECRDLPSSRNELRWLTSHAISQSRNLNRRTTTTANTQPRLVPGWRTLLRSYVKRRGRGEPLQYILGSQPFGELEILCNPGVLIPRGETEVYTTKIGCLTRDFLVEEWGLDLGRRRRPLRVLDLCTGTGCIPLCVYEMLSRWKRGQSHGNKGLRFKVLGVDISTTALDLARDNLRHNISLGYLPKEASNEIAFEHADVLPPTQKHLRPGTQPYIINALEGLLEQGRQEIDILTANPPYISPRQFASGRTTRSVRKYEPRLALVPTISSHVRIPLGPTTIKLTPVPGDEFYHHILPLSKQLNAGLIVLEVGDTEQAYRVVELAKAALMTGDKEEDTVAEGKEPAILLELWFDDGRTEVLPAGNDVALKENSDGQVCSSMRSDEDEVSRDPQEVSARAVVIWKRAWAVWRSRRLNEREKSS